MVKPKDVILKLKKDEAFALQRILGEENLELNAETISEAILHKYVSVNECEAFQLKQMYSGNWDLRRTACAIFENYSEHPRPAIENLVPAITMLEKHLAGIPFAEECDPLEHGDYDPNRRVDWCDGMYRVFEAYDREAERIDCMRQSVAGQTLYTGIPEGDGGESELLTNHEMYQLVKSGFFKEKAVAMRQELEDPYITPSRILHLLWENWSWYTAPRFRKMTDCVVYCITCAADFPDTPEARKAFRHAVQLIHFPQTKE